MVGVIFMTNSLEYERSARPASFGEEYCYD